MDILTKNKDTNILILSKLNSRDLRNVLLVNKDLSNYNNNILWFHYHKGKHYFENLEDTMQRSWKEFSLLLFFYSLDPGDYKVTLQGSPDKPLGLYNWGMSRAAFDGHGDVVNYCILNGAKDWSWANKSAFAGHQMDLVKFFSKKLMQCGQRFVQ